MENIDNFLKFTEFFAPGFVFLKIRSFFVLDTKGWGQDRWSSYAAFSFIYYTLFCETLSSATAQYYPPVFLVLFILVIPSFLVFIFLYLRPAVHSLFKKIKLPLLNPAPTAWDYKFASRKTEWIIVTLKNGEQIFGWFGKQSIASSEKNERDIYIEKVYTVDMGTGIWMPTPNSLLIKQDQIEYLEFFEDPIKLWEGKE